MFKSTIQNQDIELDPKKVKQLLNEAKRIDKHFLYLSDKKIVTTNAGNSVNKKKN